MVAKRLALTPGEPAGVGPDLVIELARRGSLGDTTVLCDPDLLAERAHTLGVPIEILAPDDIPPGSQPEPGRIIVEPEAAPGPVRPGIPDPVNAEYVLRTLRRAATGCMNGEYLAMITGPVQKSVINEAGIPFTGHTEFLAKLSGVPEVVMLLAADTLRVALVTTHLPLARVPAAITAPRIRITLDILDRALRENWKIARPHILVAGLNPHAGEQGHLGREELDIIGPALEAARKDGIDLEGPLPADTLFTPPYLERADAVLAMYHDQGLPVLKHAGFGRAVNITLGLPFLRTSVDHGTALPLAGSGRADPGSLQAALDAARALAALQEDAPRR